MHVWADCVLIIKVETIGTVEQVVKANLRNMGILNICVVVHLLLFNFLRTVTVPSTYYLLTTQIDLTLIFLQRILFYFICSYLDQVQNYQRALESSSRSTGRRYKKKNKNIWSKYKLLQ